MIAIDATRSHSQRRNACRILKKQTTQMLLFRKLKSYKNFSPEGYLDIGANTGEFACRVKKHFPSIKNFLLIEANENCKERLDQLPWDSEICLLSDSEKILDYYEDPNNPTGTGNSYFKETTSFFKDSRPKKLKSTTLDQVKNNYNYIYDFVKIDTQGSELDILRGAPNTILGVKHLLLECCPDNVANYNDGAPSEKEIVKYLSSIGFSYHVTINEHIWRSFDTNTQGYSIGTVFQKDILFSREPMSPTLITHFLSIASLVKKILLKTCSFFQLQ